MEPKIFPHPADIEVEIYGKTLEELFRNAAVFLCDTITPREKVEECIKRSIEVESEDLEALLYDFLEQILVLHDAENLVFRDVKVKALEKRENSYYLKAVLTGEEFDPEKHESGTLVKAVTYHEMKIGKKKINDEELWFAHIVFDI